MEPTPKRARLRADWDEEEVLRGSMQAYDPDEPLLNFSPGPGALPPSVLKEMQAEMLNFRGTGLSIMCMSHRSPEFGAVFDETMATLRSLMRLPESHALLFAHGGGHGQFAAVPLNLCAAGKQCRADYIVTGRWSQKAATEASKYVTVNYATKCPDSRLPPRRSWKLDSGASYRYLCSNETVEGLEFHEMPAFDDGVPLVVDMSSDIATKVIDWSRVAVAFACVPKNLGHAGLTVVMVRKDLLAEREAQPITPGVLDWRTTIASGGMWNTPATYNIYSTGKVAAFIEAQGGLDAAAEATGRKAAAIYAAIDESGGFYGSPVEQRADRSRCNLPFDVCGGDEAATNAFLIAAHKRNIVGLRVLTPFGVGQYLRASVYTGTSVESAEALAAFMRSFAKFYCEERARIGSPQESLA